VTEQDEKNTTADTPEPETTSGDTQEDGTASTDASDVAEESVASTDDDGDTVVAGEGDEHADVSGDEEVATAEDAAGENTAEDVAAEDVAASASADEGVDASEAADTEDDRDKTETQAATVDRDDVDGVCTAEEAADAIEEANEAGESAGDVMKVAHVIGYSTPDDTFRAPGSSDTRSLEELAALGIEPDEGPGNNLLYGLVAFVVVLAITGFGLAAVFQVLSRMAVEKRADVTVDARLLETRTASADALARDGTNADRPNEVYVPIEVAMRAIVMDPTLLEPHPHGVAPDPPVRPGAERAQVVPDVRDVEPGAIVLESLDRVEVRTVEIVAPPVEPPAEAENTSASDSLAEGDDVRNEEGEGAPPLQAESESEGTAPESNPGDESAPDPSTPDTDESQ